MLGFDKTMEFMTKQTKAFKIFNVDWTRNYIIFWMHELNKRSNLLARWIRGTPILPILIRAEFVGR